MRPYSRGRIGALFLPQNKEVEYKRNFVQVFRENAICIIVSDDVG